MAPKDYIQARENVQEKATSAAADFSVLIDGQPYYPNFKVDTNDLESIRKVVAIRFLSEGGDADNSSSSQYDQWPVSVVSGGITNQLYRVDCTLPSSSVGDEDNDTKNSKKTSVLVRIFGAEGLINRDIENSTYAALASQNLAPRYYGRFANGRLEEYLNGMIPLQPQQMSDPKISKAIAQQLAVMHTKFTIPDELKEYHNPQPAQPSMWTDLHDWIDSALKASFQSPNDTERAQSLELSKIPAELDWLRRDVVPKTATMGFCHNDMLAANILYCPTDTSGSEDVTVRLIDFEYGGINYHAFDIANHFNEFAGGTDDGITNYDWFPTKSQQLSFLKNYLQLQRATDDTASATEEEEVGKWYNLIQPFLLANHLYWGLWAVNQASTEGCTEFDYLLYATNRINRYYECKKNWKQAQYIGGRKAESEFD